MEVIIIEQLIVKNLNQLKKQTKDGMIIESINKLMDTDKKRIIIGIDDNQIISKEYRNYSTPLIDKKGNFYEYFFTEFDEGNNMVFKDNGNIEYLVGNKEQQDKFKEYGKRFELGQTWLTIKIYQ